MKTEQTAMSAVLLATLGLALKGIWARLAYGSGFGVGDVLFYRALLALPLVLAGGFALRRSGQRLLPDGPRDGLLAVALGAFFSLGMWCDFQAIESVGAGVSRVILFGFPLLVMLLDGAVLSQWPTRKSLLNVGLAWLGLGLIAAGRADVRMGQLSGSIGWAFASLGSYATFVWCSGRLAPRIGAARLTFLSNLSTSACVIVAVAASHRGEFSTPATEPLLWVGAMVAVSTVVPYYLMNEGIARLGAARASVLSMLGPLVTLFAAYLVLNERLAPVQLLGSVALLVGVLGAKNHSPKPTAPHELTASRPDAAPTPGSSATEAQEFARLSPRDARCGKPGYSPG